MRASVIIPAYNSADTIEDTLRALKEQTEKDFEVIVVDDGSIDGTRDVVEKYDVKLFRQDHMGPAAARNLGARKATGEVVVFTDSDCVPQQDWLKEMLNPMEEPGIVGVQGRYKTRQRELIARFAQLEIEERYQRMKKQEYIDFIGSYSAAYRRRVFLEVGGFDESFPMASGEDPELSFRLAKQGYKMVFNDRAIVYHRHPASLRDYLIKKFYRAYWRVALYKRHTGKAVRDSYTPPSIKIQIALVYLFIVSVMTSPFTGLLPAQGILLALLASTLPSSIRYFKKDRSVGLASPAIILLRTAVFGFGLLYGAVRTL
jgi:GT2 family glycosyltransferase